MSTLARGIVVDAGKQRTVCALALAGLLLPGCATREPSVGKDGVAAYRAERRRAAHRQRRIIFNNDGDDHLIDGAASVEAFLAKRTTPLLKSQVDTVFYCTSRPFGMFTHNTKVGDVLTTKTGFRYGRNNIVRDLIDLGTDPLRVMTDCCHKNGIEVFWSMRMNDTHDVGHTPDKPHLYFSTFKRTHPECLLGSREKRPKHGSWSAVDFAQPVVREFLLRVFEEVCNGYDIDGVELDFFRHLVFFKTVADGGVATPAELHMMTELVRGIRAITEDAGMRRGRPILMGIRTPDSVGYCKGMGLDIERWMAEGLIDLFVAAGDFRLNPREYSTGLGRRHGIPVYCDLDPAIGARADTEFARNSIATLRARAMNAWAAGAAGIYMFNHFDPRNPLWWELGDAKRMRTQDKLYFVNVMGRAGYLRADSALPNGGQYENLPVLHPRTPMTFAVDKPIAVPLTVGEDLASGAGAAKVVCHVLTGLAARPCVKLNSQALAASGKSGNWFDYSVEPELVKRGVNTVEVSMARSDAKAAADAWDVEYDCSKPPLAPWVIGRRRAGTSATVQEGALLIADRSTETGSYLYYTYPGFADPSRVAVFEARAKVIAGRSMILAANGVSEEEVRLQADRVVLQHARLSCEFDTADAFHVYRVAIEGKSIRLYVDGKLKLDGAGRFTYPAHSGRNMASFGASTSPTTGEALWQRVRLRTGIQSLFDLMLSVRHQKQAAE